MKRFFVEKTDWDTPAILAIEDIGDGLAYIGNGAVIGSISHYEDTENYVEVSEAVFDAAKTWIQYAIETEQELAELMVKQAYLIEMGISLLWAVSGRSWLTVSMREPKPRELGFRIVE